MRDRWLVPLRRALGDDAAALAWAQGRALGLEHALALAVVEVSLPDPSNVHKASGLPTNLLTRREREVAALLTRGLSNRQIAEQLVITERTVASHIEHILEKLGFASRHQVGAWMVEHDLLN
jgi:DNA-binding NarL/FixJ family response regulator